MPSRRAKWFIGGALAVCLLVALPGRAEVETLNDPFARLEMEVWNGLADLLEIVQGGIAVGTGDGGGEIAITDLLQLGYYDMSEKGFTFPLIPLQPIVFVPLLWTVPWLDDEKPLFRVHEGEYGTWSFLWLGDETTPREDVRFPRAPWDLRAQVVFPPYPRSRMLALFPRWPVMNFMLPRIPLVHFYLNLSMEEAKDCFAGLAYTICFFPENLFMDIPAWEHDPRKDDQQLDPNARREPARQLARGAANVLTGMFEVPFNIHLVNQDKGGVAAYTEGALRGVWRGGTRMVVGAFEAVTFPMGWDPIIEPEFFMRPARTTDWRVNSPQFRRRY